MNDQVELHLIHKKIKEISRKINTLIDRSVRFRRQRWIYLALLYSYVLWKIFRYDYLGIMYIIGLNIIYLLVQYLTPSGLPDPDQDQSQNILFIEESRSILNNQQRDRPVLRALDQFNLWKKLLLIGGISWFCTCFQIFLFPVYWPFLLIYFLWLIGLAIFRHYTHMKKYGYTFKDFETKKIQINDQDMREQF